MKKKFKDENDKFEFNVVKLNLLNIIDKLKLQIDKEKSKFKKFKERVSSENWFYLGHIYARVFIVTFWIYLVRWKLIGQI